MKRLLKNAFKAIALSLTALIIFSSPANALYPFFEDFLTYTETDPYGEITVSPLVTSWEDVRHADDRLVYYDFGADFFSGYTWIDFEFSINSSSANGARVAHIALSQGIGDMADLNTATIPTLTFETYKVATPSPYYRGKVIAWYDDGSYELGTSAFGLSPDTNYYASVKYDPDNTTWQVIVWTDSSRTVVSATSYVTTLDEINNYQYFYSLMSEYNGAFAEACCGHYGYTKNVIIDAGLSVDVETGTYTYNGYDEAIGFNTDIIGNVVSGGGENITAGFYHRNYTDNESWQFSAVGGTYATGENFTAILSNLTAGKTYEYKAFGQNSTSSENGTAANFTVSSVNMSPVIDFNSPSYVLDLLNLNADLNGLVVYDGGENVTAWFNWREIGTENWTITGNQTDLQTSDTFTQQITGLSLGTAYEFMGQAQNSYGTANTSINQFSLNTSTMPDVTTQPASNITYNQAVLNATVNDLGNDTNPILWFRFKELDSDVWTVTTYDYINSTGNYTKLIGNLLPVTEYQFEAIVQSEIIPGDDKTDYGGIRNFVTLPENSIPVITTGNATLQDNNVIARAYLVYDGNAGQVSSNIRYKPHNSATWTTLQTQFTDGYTGVLVFQITDYNFDVTYDYQAVAVNVVGEAQGQIKTFRVSSTTGTLGGSGSDNPNTPSGIADDILDDVVETLGLGGELGKWTLMFIILIIIALLFAPLMFSQQDTARTVIGVIWAILSLTVIGAFIFTGQLGVMPIIILAGVFVMFLIVVGSIFITGRREA